MNTFWVEFVDGGARVYIGTSPMMFEVAVKYGRSFVFDLPNHNVRFKVFLSKSGIVDVLEIGRDGFRRQLQRVSEGEFRYGQPNQPLLDPFDVAVARATEMML